MCERVLGRAYTQGATLVIDRTAHLKGKQRHPEVARLEDALAVAAPGPCLRLLGLLPGGRAWIRFDCR